MNENPKKLKNSGHNYMTSIWFNNRLFSWNGTPLKFYLEGYGPSQFHEIVKIIEAYGGQLSAPDAPDTFIFCESNHPVDVKKHDIYDMQYFQDSIIALYPQDLMKYKLRRSQNQELFTFEDEVRSPRPGIEDENNDKPPKLIKYITNQPSTSCQNDDDGLSDLHDDCMDFCSSDDEEIIELQDKGDSCIGAVARVDIDRLDDSQFADSSINPQMNDHNRDMHATNSFQWSSEGEWSTDDSDTSTSESDDEYRPSGYRRQYSVKRVRDEKKKVPVFKEEDDEAIIKWLMKKKVMPTIKEERIWHDFLVEKVLPHHNLSIWNIRGHYKRKLIMHPTYVKWIEDMKKSGHEFKTKPHLPYTEEENRAMIQYIIDNNAYHRARGEKIWREFLESRESLNPRTNRALLTHFVQALLPKYSMYVDDPKAYRKFEKLVIDQKMKKRNFKGDN